MKKILIVANSFYQLEWFLIFFLKYQVKNNNYENDVTAWGGETSISNEIKEKKYFFNYNNYDIEFKFINNGQDNCFSFSQFLNLKKNYDKIILIKSKNFYKDLDQNEIHEIKKIAPVVQTIFLNVEESITQEINLQRSEQLNYKIITCDFLNKYNSSQNILSIPFLSFFHFFFEYGFNYLNLNEFNNQKKYLIGTYHRKNYKTERDQLLKQIKQILPKDELLKIYKSQFMDIDNIREVSKYLNYNKGYWNRNHISTYTDFVESVVNLIFETKIDYNTSDIFFTEKTFKSLLFSKLNIYTIMFSSVANLIYLRDNGYWFLNFEYIDFDKFSKTDNYKNYQMVNKSILKTIQFLHDIYEKSNYDINIVYEKLNYKFKQKLQNNYNLIFDEIGNSKNSDTILNFLLKDTYKNESKIKLL